jgi:hypothetical protein
LVNDAFYIAKCKDIDFCKRTYDYVPKDNREHAGEWTATGTQFAVSYVFKKLFSKEKITFEDMCETKSVSTALYLDMNENMTDGEHNYRFVGKVGRFCPVKDGCGGGILLRETTSKTGEKGYAAATGSKGYRWLESEMVQELGKVGDIERAYYDKMVDDAVKAISTYGDFEWFVSDDPYISETGSKDKPPWSMPCGNELCTTCFDCSAFHNDEFHMDCGLGYDISNIIMKHPIIINN